MADILHALSIRTNIQTVFKAVSEPAGLDTWWTKESSGDPKMGATLRLFFGEGYDWRATVTVCEPPKTFEIRITESMEDWTGTTIRFDLQEAEGGTTLRFSHTGWKEQGEHFSVSSYCWACYLRIMKRSFEHGERVPYEQRDSA